MAIEFSTLMVKLGADIRELKTKFDTAQGVVGGFAEKGAASMKTWREANQEMVRRVGRNMAIMGAAITGATVVAVKGFADFQEGMSFINTMLDDQTSKYLPEFEEGIRDLAQKSGDSFESLQKGMYDVLSAMIAPAEAMDVLTEANEAAIAGASNTAIAVDGLTTILNSYGLEADKAGDVSDWFFTIIKRGKTTFAELAPSIGKVAPIAAAAGVSLDELGAMLALLTRNGVKTDIAITSLKAVITAFQSPTKEAADMAKVLGFEMSATALKEHGLAWAMEQVNKANTEQMAALIGNVRAKLATSVATANLSDLEKDLAAQLDRTGNKTEAYNKRSADLNMQFKKLNQTFQNFMHEAIAPIIPAITSMVLKLIEVTKGVREWVQDNPKLTGTLVKLVAVIGPVLTGLGAFLILLPELVLGIELVLGAASKLSLTMLPLVAIIAGVAIELAYITKLWHEVKDAQEGATEAQKEASDASVRLSNNLRKSLGELEWAYDDLTDKEKELIATQHDALDVLDELIAKANEDGEVTEKEAAAIHTASTSRARAVRILVEEIESRKEKKPIVEENIEATKKEAAATEDLTTKFKTEAEANKALVTQYKELNKQMGEGTVSKEEYKNKLNELVESFGPILGGTDEVIKKMNELDETDPNIKAKFEMFGFEEYQDTTDRIRKINQSIVLEGLEGDEKRIQSIRFDLQNFEYVQQKKIEAERVRYETAARLAGEAHNQEMILLMSGLQFKQGIEKEKAQAEIDAKTEAFKFTQQKGEESWQRLQDEMNQETADRQKLTHLQISNIEDVAAEKLKANAEAKEGLGDEKDGIYDLADTYNKLAETSKTTASERMSVAKEVGDAYEDYARRISTISKRAAKRHKRLTGETARHVTTTTALRRAPQDIAFSSFSGFQGGSHFVPRTGDYRLHRGEKVTNAEVARGEGEGVNGVGGGGVTIVNLFKEEMVPEIMMKYPNAVLNIVGSDIARRGMTRKLIEGVAKNA